jgi:hypothetical protein
VAPTSVLRPRVCGLPLQRSVLASVDEVGPLLGVPERLAWLDEDATLHADFGRLGVAARALVAGSVEPVLALTAEGRARCEEVDRLAVRIETADPRRACTALADVAAAVARVVPFAIATKVVPDALAAAIPSGGPDGRLPFPSPSPGVQVALDLLRLAERCDACGWPPERVAAAWPRVDAGVANAVRAFAAEHVGWGPLAWETPGHEDPATVVTLMAAAYGDPERRRVAAGRARRRADPGGDQGGPLREALAWWLRFLELETWHVRRAFYAAIVPLLCAAPRGRDLLFATIDEVRAGGPAPEDAARRRAAYLADTAYLERHGVTPSRLEALARS